MIKDFWRSVIYLILTILFSVAIVIVAGEMGLIPLEEYNNKNEREYSNENEIDKLKNCLEEYKSKIEEYKAVIFDVRYSIEDVFSSRNQSYNRLLEMIKEAHNALDIQFNDPYCY